MFLTETDYLTLITDEDRGFIEQSSKPNREAAEAMAIDEMKGYMRQQYDVAAIFDISAVPDPDTRPKAVVMFCMDITLFHLCAMLPGRYMPEIRVTRYDNAIIWLNKVQAGRIDPGLPAVTDTTTGESLSAIRSGSNEKQDWSW